MAVSVQASERIVKLPGFDAWSSSTIELKQIELSDTATILDIDAFYAPHNWITIDKDSYLKEGDTKYPIRYGEGIELSKKITMPESGTISFRLVFPPLPKNVGKIDFIEGDDPRAFRIWGIRLDGKPVTSALSTRKNPDITPTVDVPIFQNGTATITGKIEGYQSNMNFGGTASLFNSLTINYDQYPFTVDPDGTFKIEIPLFHSSIVNISSPFIRGDMYIKPGETTSVLINLPEVTRSQSKLRKDEPSLGIAYFFEGPMAAFNNEKINSKFRPKPVGPTSQQEYMQMMQDIHTMNLDEYKAYWKESYRKIVEEVNNNNEISKASKDAMILSTKINTTRQLLTPYMIEQAYRMINKIPRDSVLPNMQSLRPTKEYYDFIAEYLPNDPLALYNFSYFNVLRMFQYQDLSGEGRSGQDIDNIPILASYMGTDKGVLFDLMKAQQMVEPIMKFTPLTTEEVAALAVLPSPIKQGIEGMNSDLLRTIEDNKKLSTYKVSQENIADIPEEELFNAIMSLYRGKVIFVDFWATWCGPCKVAFKSTTPVKEELKDKDVVFVYLAGENSPIGDWEKMRPDIPGEHFRMTGKQWSYMEKKYGIQGVPSYMVVAKDGSPAYFSLGFMGVPKMKEVLTAELEK